MRPAAAASPITLYDHPGSTNSYKVHLLLALLRMSYECVSLPFGAAKDRPAWFLEVNPRGLVPMLKAGEDYLWDSTAILVYLARHSGNGGWFPADSMGAAYVAQWLALAQSEILHGIVLARHILRGSRRGDLDDARSHGASALGVMERRLLTADWLASEQPTIADVACYPHSARAEESGFNLRDYPAVTRWIRRVEALPGWIARAGGAGRPWP